MFTLESKWTPNKPLEAKHCYGTTSIEHPAVSMITTERGKYYLGGLLSHSQECLVWYRTERMTAWGRNLHFRVGNQNGAAYASLLHLTLST